MYNTVLPALSWVAYHGYEGTEGVTGFPNIGTWLIFGVVLSRFEYLKPGGAR